MQKDAISRINALIAGSSSFCLATIISSPGSDKLLGQKMIVLKDGSFEGGTGQETLDESIRSHAVDALNLKKKQTLELERGICVFFDIPAQKSRLLICGAGHIARPLAQFALTVGFSVNVIDDRPDFADPGRFEGCDVIAGDFVQALHAMKIDSATFAVIITRGHEHDVDCLTEVLSNETAYVGLIGSRRRTRFVLGLLSRQGIPSERLQEVFTPIGLPLGSESPEEIALSIAAELVCVRRKGAEYAGNLRRLKEICGDSDE